MISVKILAGPSWGLIWKRSAASHFSAAYELKNEVYTLTKGEEND